MSLSDAAQPFHAVSPPGSTIAIYRRRRAESGRGAGDDTAGIEQNLRQSMPNWMALDTRLIAERFMTDGTVPR